MNQSWELEQALQGLNDLRRDLSKIPTEKLDLLEQERRVQQVVHALGCELMREVFMRADVKEPEVVVNGKRWGNQLGFDIDAAVNTLHKEAIKSGAVPQEDPRAGNPMYTAMAHLHGVEADRCRKSPCRVAGLCHALYELVQYRAQVDAAAEFIEAANETEVMSPLNSGESYAQRESPGPRNQKRRQQSQAIPPGDDSGQLRQGIVNGDPAHRPSPARASHRR